MKKIASYLIAVVAALIAGPIVAQSPASSADEPLVASRPLKGRYLVVYSYTEPLREMKPERKAELPKSHHPRRVLKVEGALDGSLRKEIRYWSDGLITECWAFKGTALYDEPGGDQVRIVDLGAFIGEYGIPDHFPGFERVARENQQPNNKASYKGRKAVHYQLSDWEAWVDPVTRLPLALRVGAELREYQFSNDAPAPMTLPARFQTYLKELEELRNLPPDRI